MKLSKTLAVPLYLLLVTSNSLADGKWLDWGTATMTNLDKLTTISGEVEFSDRCHGGSSSEVTNWILRYLRGEDYDGQLYLDNDRSMADVRRYETYINYYNHHQANEDSPEIEMATREEFDRWASNHDDINAIMFYSKYGKIERVFGFEDHWIENTNETYASVLILGDQLVILSSGECSEGEVTSEETANQLVQSNLDQIRRFLASSDTYRELR